jgi:hypothetical protein
MSRLLSIVINSCAVERLKDLYELMGRIKGLELH